MKACKLILLTLLTVLVSSPLLAAEQDDFARGADTLTILNSPIPEWGIVVSYLKLSDDRMPKNDLMMFGFSSTVQTETRWLAVTLDLLYSDTHNVNTSTETDAKISTWEIAFGPKFRYSWRYGSGIDLGGGVTLVYGDYDSPGAGSSLTGHDFGAGYWAEATLYLYTNFLDPGTLAFFVRHSSIEMDVWDADPGGMAYGLKVMVPTGSI